MFHSKFQLLVLVPGLLLAGCSDSLQQRAEVSGTVTYRGKPLPGGIVTFISDKGFQNSATIDENGHYTISVGIGSNKITVDNRLLKKTQQTTGPRLKPQEGTTQQTTLTGTYVPIRDIYASAESSGLGYMVTSGSQVKDIPLE